MRRGKIEEPRSQQRGGILFREKRTISFRSEGERQPWESREGVLPSSSANEVVLTGGWRERADRTKAGDVDVPNGGGSRGPVTTHKSSEVETCRGNNLEKQESFATRRGEETRGLRIEAKILAKRGRL